MLAAKDELFTRPSGGYNIARSVRFRNSASAYFGRTPASNGNRQIFTWSGWVKRGTLGSRLALFNSGDTGSGILNGVQLLFFGDNTITASATGGITINLVTSALYRDPSAWYHIVFAVDTTQATSSNRVKIYVNGSQITSFSTATYPSQNQNFDINNTLYPMKIGASVDTATTVYYYDGYMTEINYVDGQQLTPSSFGSTNAITGVWQPAKYTGTYGTNGFYLNFSDNSNNTAATIGKDYSGNGNNWTPNNISVTAGATYDSMTDVPTLTSATAANYCTWNPLAVGTNITTASGNLNATASSTSNAILQGTFGITSGKWYWEVTLSSGTSFWGGSIIKSTVGLNYSSLSSGDAYSYSDDGKKYNGQTATTYGNTYTTNDLVSVAYNADTGKIWFAKNGTWQASGDPSAGTNEAFSGISGTYMPAALLNSATGIANFGQRPFSYTPPTGFVALNTYNLPASTITNGATYMAATLITMTGSTQSVSSLAFQPDFLWFKSRASGSYNHALFNSVVGRQNGLCSNSTGSEASFGTSSAGNDLASFDASGFTVGPNQNFGVFSSGSASSVAWGWKAGTTSASNTNGSITSTVSVGATQGFSVVTYTGNGSSSATVGHGLGVTPSMIIVKARNNGSDWETFHTSLGANFGIRLNTTAAKVAASSTAGGIISTSPTSTTFGFTAGTSNVNNANENGVTFVAYCFSAVAGYSAFGSYIGNGTQGAGPFVFLGFRPRYVLVKNASVGGRDWHDYDSSRSPFNYSGSNILKPNTADAELTGRNDVQIDMLSNGFRLIGNDAGINENGATFIYICFAENPFKNALAR